MATKVLDGSPWTNQPRGTTPPAESRRPFGSRRALELVAMRGKDVIGVRHLLDGTRAYLGRGPEAFAPISVGDPAGRDFLVGEVNGTDFTVHVPARARVRSHLANGLGQLGIGPLTIQLAEGERTVLVLPAGIQIRARIVPLETLSKALTGRKSSVRWLVLVGVLYAAALVFCASMVPDHPPARAQASVQRLMLAVASRVEATTGL